MTAYQQTVDHLGFTIETESEFKIYEKSQAQYLRILAKRSARWKSMIRLNEHKLNPGKLRRFIRKGIPNEHRSLIWMRVSGAETMMSAQPSLYKQLQSMKPPTDVAEAIDIDIPRTFPLNVFFKDETSKDSLLPPLKRVLYAHAILNPKIGYCQGLNYVTAVMLLVMRDEHKAFWLLNAVTTKLVPEYYVHEPVAMLGLQTDLGVLSSLVKEKIPAIDKMMSLHKVDFGFVCTKWFVCLFIDTLPIETVLRIWDAFFNEGRKVLFRVALTLITKGETNLISCTALHDIMTQFQQVTKDTYTWYSHNFMELIYEESGKIPSQHLEKLTKFSHQKVLTELGLT